MSLSSSPAALVVPGSGPSVESVKAPKAPRPFKPDERIQALTTRKSAPRVDRLIALVPLTDEQVANRSEKAETKAVAETAKLLATGLPATLAGKIANSRVSAKIVVGSGAKALVVSPSSRLGRVAMAYAQGWAE